MPCEEFHQRLVHFDPEGKVVVELPCVALGEVRVLGIMIVEIHGQKADDLCDFFDPVVRVFRYVGLVKVELAEIEIEIVEGVLKIFELGFISIEDADRIVVFDSSPSVQLHFSSCVHSFHAGPLIETSPCLPQLLLKGFFVF